MKFVANEGKKVEIEVEKDIYIRHAIKTKFVNANDDYLEIMKTYVLGIYRGKTKNTNYSH